ncbi:hypothetical protein P7C73_g3361, partial [Tremellales sp. Uapishka_1]
MSAHPDVYTNTEYDDFPGAKQRSRPGQGPGEVTYDQTIDSYALRLLSSQQNCPLITRVRNGRRVSAKPSNQAFLNGQRRRLEHEAKLRALPASRQSSAVLSYLLPGLIFLLLLSNFLTATFSFNLYPTYKPAVLRYWRTSGLNPSRAALVELTPIQLSMYDGSDPSKPVYLALDGDVYDVSAGRRIYGPGGSYHVMAGKDAARSFTTGCFQMHQTHDLRGLSDQELDSLKHWKSFFANHEKYFKVGTVNNPPIDPHSPIPPSCHEAETAPGETAAKKGASMPEPLQGHSHPRQEL